MSLNQTSNSFQSQFNFTRSTFVRYSAADEFISFHKLIQECSKHHIQIIQLPDKRLQSGLNLIPFKVTSKNSHQTFIIFLTKYTQKSISLTAYKNGKVIEQSNANNQEQIAKVLKKLIDSHKSQKEDYQVQSLKVIQKLDKKSSQIAKIQNNQMMAIQKLKSTPEYQSLIQLQIQLTMEIQSISQSQIDKQQKIESQNSQLIDKILLIEKLKTQIEENQYDYEEACKNLRNIKQMITQFLEKQQQKIKKMEITNENQLNDFLIQVKKLKKLQLQKRFLH